MMPTFVTRRRATVSLFALALLSCGDPTTPKDETPTVTTVTVTGSTSDLTVGETVQLSANALDQKGATMSGQTFTWTSSNNAVATVSSTGLVTAVAAGAFDITAAVSGKSGKFTATAKAAPFVIALTAGDNQKGLTGKPLADSLTVTVTTAAGAPASGQTVTWTASGGTLSATTTTDAAGVARAQWLPALGDVTTTVTVTGAAAKTFKANARTSGSCMLTPSTATSNFGLGPSNYATLSIRPTTAHKAIAIFVDFSDVPSTETTASLTSSIITPGFALLSELSYGRSSFSATVVDKWYRMSKTSSSYGFNALTFQAQKDYIQEAMTLADADVDFSQYDVVFVFAAPTANIPVSPTLNAFVGTGITKDGKEIHNGITFGRDSRNGGGYGATVLAHETGHMMGLIDLYSLTGQDVTQYHATIQKYVGAWSLMGWTGKTGHWFAYEKLKLGYIDDGQVDCISPTTGGVEDVITPLSVSGGLKAIMVQLDASRALVAEVRAPVGADASLCAHGVVVYQVDAQIATGAGAIVIRPSKVGTDQTKINQCSTFWDGAYDATGGAQSNFTDAASGVTIQVVKAEANGAYRVRVKRP